MTSETEPGNGKGPTDGTPEAEAGRGLEFPCTYPIKAMGKSDAGLHELVVAVVSRHVTVEADAVRSRPSKGGRYESITVTVEVDTRAQLESIYADLTGHDQVLWTL